MQTALGPLGAMAPWINFLGAGVTEPGFSVNWAPPDANGAAGATQYVQWVNTDFGIFSKSSGQIIYGPAAGNTLWQPLGGACATNNDGDAIAQYDKQAQRWVMMQPVFTSPYYLCVAISTTSDATGTYNLYQFPIPSNYLPDYPKLAVWPDAYYVSFNDFTGGAFAGGSACALDRTSMLAGSAATMQCFFTGYPSLLPSDLDGDSGAPGSTAAPPSGSPNYFIDFTDTNSLNLFAFHVDWSNPSNSTFTGPTALAVATFSEACGGGTCIPQSNTSQQLDSLGDRLMYRLAYRNFGSYESMVVSQSVDTGNGNSGVRWYEIRNPGANPTVYQQGTFAPDSDYRWMPSIAEDELGDIAIGYSVSSASTYPSIEYTGRVPSDPLGTMEGETSLIAGGGSQDPNLSRWGDYTSLSVDPANDCTFWYTNEILPYSGTFNWDTQVGSFSFPGCAAAPAPDFSLTGAPATQTVSAGSGATYLIGVNPIGGYTGNVTLSVSAPNPLPTGMSVNFSPNPADITSTSSVNSNLTVSTTSETPAGTYQLTVSGTDGTNTNSATIAIVVQTPDFSLSVSPTSQTLSGTYVDYTIDVTPTAGYTGNVTLSVSSTLPSGVAASFYSNPVSITGTSPGSATMELSLTASAPAGTYNLTVSGTDGTLTHTAQFTLVIPKADFSLSVSPASQTLSGTYLVYTVDVTSTAGYTRNVTLSVSSTLPSGVTASFYSNPVSITGTGTSSATMELSLTASAPAGTYNLTVSGTDGTLTHTAQFTLVIPKADFSLTSLGSQTVAAGNSTTYTFYLNSTDYYSGNVNVSLTAPSPLPTGMTASFLSNPVNVQPTQENYSMLTLNTTISTPPGTYNLTVNGSDGTNTHTTTGTIVVQPPPPPDFSFLSEISSSGLVAGQSLNDTIQVTPTYGYTGNVTMSVTAPNPLPKGMTVSFAPNPVDVTGTSAVDSTLTIATTTATPAGGYSLTITGTDGTLTHTTSIYIGLIASSDFSLASSPVSQTVAPGGTAGYSITVSPATGFTGNVSLSATGLPTGATAQFSPNPVSLTGTSSVSSTLTVSTATSTPVGSYNLTISGNDGTLTHSTPVTMTVAIPTASISPTSLNLGGQLVGTTSAAQTATLSNSGSVSLSISSIAATGDFAETNNCGTSLAAGSNCSISVTFTPSATGTRTGSLTVTDNASGSPQTVALSGTGTAPTASLAPTSLNFAGQLVGTTSTAQQVTLSNSGSAALSISGIATTGDFAETNTCGTSLGAGSNCSISVTFTPSATGTRTGSLTVTDNASGSPQTVALSGTGTAPAASLTPTSLSFGDQVVGTTSAAQAATLTNAGNAPLTVSGISVTGDFAQTNNCGTTLAVGAKCSISVTFTPSAAGALTGTLTVSSNSPGGPVSAALSGTGAEYAPTFSPTSLDFPGQVVGTKSGGKNVKMTANGPGPLVISSISVTGEFLESNNCHPTLNQGQSCNITINFLPTAGGPASGTILVSDNAAGSPQMIPVSGTGLDFALSATPSAVTVNAGQTAQYTVTATEVGGVFNNKVNLTCSGLPTASKCHFSPGGISPKNSSASSALSIQTTAGASGTPSGTYTVIITGTSGSLTHSTAVTLIVN